MTNKTYIISLVVSLIFLAVSGITGFSVFGDWDLPLDRFALVIFCASVFLFVVFGLVAFFHKNIPVKAPKENEKADKGYYFQ